MQNLLPFLVLAIIALLLVLFGIKIASKIAGTTLNFSIALCFLFLSVVVGLTLPYNVHSVTFLVLNMVSLSITLLLMGICGRLFKKFIWG